MTDLNFLFCCSPDSALRLATTNVLLSLSFVVAIVVAAADDDDYVFCSFY
jgi:hypothetical protein